MEEIINELFIGIFLIVFGKIIDRYSIQLNLVQLIEVNDIVVQRIKRIPQYYMDNIYPMFLGGCISILILVRGIELCTEYTGVSLYARLAFCSFIGLNLVFVCFEIPKISQNLSKRFDEWSFMYKKELFKYFIFPLIFFPLIIKFLYDFIILTLQIFYL